MTLDPDRSARRLGVVVAGSLSKGLEARLDDCVSVEDMAVGRYVVVDGHRHRFFGMITDVRLSAANPEIVAAPPDGSDPLLVEVLAGTSTFGMVDVAPMLTIGRADLGSKLIAPMPVKTVPSHFAPVAEASEEDVQTVFGAEDQTHFYVGKPLDMDARICIDVKRFAERSSGIFGKSGTGKTFLTRLLLAGIVQKQTAVNLVFDMHSEYGWRGSSEGQRAEVKGLKQLFGGQVSVFTLDEDASLARGVKADHVVEIGLDQISPEDFELLKDVLDLSEAACESIHRLARRLGRDWLRQFADTEAPEREQIAADFGLNPGTLNVLHRKVERIARLPFLKPSVRDDSVKRILENLQRGQHVVLEFGRHDSLDAYLLVANFLTQRIHDTYREQVDRAMGDRAKMPRPLIITIEEAHKFLGPEVAHLTSFGKIARKLRKYLVTLLVVDQRPSSIDADVMSQIGTRVTCLLDDERDIQAVLSGIPNGQALRSVLARLDSKQQAILLGHAVPMPVVIRTREYGDDFYKDVARGRLTANGDATENRKQRLKEVEELFSR